MTALDRPGNAPLHLDVRDLRLVAAVADAGNLSRASRVLHLTQSTLSHHLADLEARLGAPLFHRLGRRLELTALGERLRDGAIPLLASLRALEEDLRAVETRDSTIDVRIATECYTIYPWLAPVALSVRKRRPNIQIKIAVDATARPLDALERGALDLAIVSSAPAGRQFRHAKLFRDELIAVVPRQHPWSARRWVDVEEFRSVHLLLYSPEPVESSFVRQTLLPAGVLPRTMSGIPLTEGLLELARADLGIAVVARWAATTHLRDATLRAVRIGRGGVHRDWHAVWPRRHPHTRLLDEIAGLIRKSGPRRSQ